MNQELLKVTDLHISFGTPAEYCLAAADPRLKEVET